MKNKNKIDEPGSTSEFHLSGFFNTWGSPTRTEAGNKPN